MYRFARRAPLDLTVYTPPLQDDRSGMPLTQGYVLIMIHTVADEHCSPETLAALEQVDPEAWYAGQLLESVLNELEDRDPSMPAEIGKTIYYTLRSQFVAAGMQTPEDVIITLPQAWQHVTRGDSGVWRTTLKGPGHAHVEAEQPYNCQFEEGALHGALEAFDATNVQIDHTQCMRRGAPYCVLDVHWQ